MRADTVDTVPQTKCTHLSSLFHMPLVLPRYNLVLLAGTEETEALTSALQGDDNWVSTHKTPYQAVLFQRMECIHTG